MQAKTDHSGNIIVIGLFAIVVTLLSIGAIGEMIAGFVARVRNFSGHRAKEQYEEPAYQSEDLH
ncbi:MAG: hypothetical protein B6D59_00470 [Campylobacteraceae bacterium 4484_4]|nr:MAG: hypothetical protein B6D59_00470 [Campylobacteraceae bacterium 4484_4]